MIGRTVIVLLATAAATLAAPAFVNAEEGTPALANTVLPFQNGVSNAPSWAKQVDGK